MVEAAFPSPSGLPKIADVLGPIDADYYLGIPTIEYQSKIRGVLDMWAGVSIPIEYFPGNEVDFFTSTALEAPSNRPPLISFQGKKDEVFEFEEGPDQLVTFSPPPAITDSDTTNYNSTAICLLDGAAKYFLDDDEMTEDLLVGSTLNLYHVLEGLDTLAEMYVDCTAMHGVVDGDDYGTPATTKEQIWTYMVERAAVFFQAVLNHKSKASLGNSLFIECKNSRSRCSQSNDSCSHTLDDCPD